MTFGNRYRQCVVHFKTAATTSAQCVAHVPGNSIWRARVGDGRQPTVPDQETLGYKFRKGAAYD